MFISYLIIIGLSQFREDSREQRCPVDMLLVLGANDLIRSGPSSLSEGLREWKITLQTYSHERCHVYGSTLTNLDMCLCYRAPRLESLPGDALSKANSLIRYRFSFPSFFFFFPLSSSFLSFFFPSFFLSLFDFNFCYLGLLTEII